MSSNIEAAKIRKISRGFTLIELLVVISIIGTLASIIMSSIMAARTKATSLVTYLTVQQYQHALEQYMNAHLELPFVGDDSVCLGPATATCKADNIPYTGSALLVSLLSPYMDNFPQPKTINLILSGETHTSAIYSCGGYYTDDEGVSTCLGALIIWPAPGDDGRNCINPTFFVDGGKNSYCFIELLPPL
jgi:prepilin-type N-terminal cleavage/methylation domain-containing protein